MNGGAVGLVKRGFEYIRYIQFAGDFYIVCASVKGGVEIFKHVDAAEKGERGIVGKGAVIEIHAKLSFGWQVEICAAFILGVKQYASQAAN